MYAISIPLFFVHFTILLSYSLYFLTHSNFRFFHYLSNLLYLSHLLSDLRGLFSPPLCYLNFSMIRSSHNPYLNFSIFSHQLNLLFFGPLFGPLMCLILCISFFLPPLSVLICYLNSSILCSFHNPSLIFFIFSHPLKLSYLPLSF